MELARCRYDRYGILKKTREKIQFNLGGNNCDIINIDKLLRIQGSIHN